MPTAPISILSSEKMSAGGRGARAAPRLDAAPKLQPPAASAPRPRGEMSRSHQRKGISFPARSTVAPSGGVVFRGAGVA